MALLRRHTSIASQYCLRHFIRRFCLIGKFCATRFAVCQVEAAISAG